MRAASQLSPADLVMVMAEQARKARRDNNGGDEPDRPDGDEPEPDRRDGAGGDEPVPDRRGGDEPEPDRHDGDEPARLGNEVQEASR